MNLMRIRRQRAVKGFNLIEAAIVLGIVGLVVGGIWVAATSVYANLRSKSATDQLLKVAQSVRALYATSSVTGAANGTDLTSAMAQANVLPTDVLTTAPNAATAANTVNPWGGNVAVYSAPNNNGTAQGGFAITFTRIPAAACTDFVMRNLGAGRDAGLFDAIGAAAGAAAYAAPAGTIGLVAGQPLPLTTASGASLCNSAAANANRNVTFYFNLRA